MAARIVKGMAEKWNPRKYKDTYANDLMALIRKKVTSGKTTEIDESEPAPKRKGGVVVDLMPLLKKSLEKNRSGRSEVRRRPRAVARIAQRSAHTRRRQAH